jgi:hypothetical protein
VAGIVSLIGAPLFSEQLAERLQFSAALGADLFSFLNIREREFPVLLRAGGHAEAFCVNFHVFYLCHGLRDYGE